MDEARRFLRYVTPGLAFLVELLLLCWVLRPEFVEGRVSDLKDDAGLGLALLTIVGSGGLGFLFGAIHHQLHWSRFAVVDHRDFIRRARSRGMLRLIDSRNGEPVSDKVEPTRVEAWSIVTAVWHERVEDSLLLKGGEARASTLVDLMHSMGSARVASFVALVGSLLLIGRETPIDLHFEPVARFVVALALGLMLVCLFARAYRHTGESAQRFIEQVLDDALAKCGSVDTHVLLKLAIERGR